MGKLTMQEPLLVLGISGGKLTIIKSYDTEKLNGFVVVRLGRPHAVKQGDACGDADLDRGSGRSCGKKVDHSGRSVTLTPMNFQRPRTA